MREAIAAALDEWDHLAGNSEYRINEPHRAWLQAVLAAAEPEDAWGRHVRAARAETDDAKKKATLAALAESADVAKVPARALTHLAGRLDPAPRVALLRRAQAQYPADFWVNHNLGAALQNVTPPEPDEAVRFLTAAVALRPDSPGCVLNLGLALRGTGRADEAIACCRKALELDPKLADDLGAGHRYDAAGLAALSAAGRGEDAGELGDPERARLRKLALDWLRADLALRTKQLESGTPADRAAARQALRHWQQDADLAGVRDAAALTKLPADEREAFAQLWADVAALLNKAEEKPK